MSTKKHIDTFRAFLETNDITNYIELNNSFVFKIKGNQKIVLTDEEIQGIVEEFENEEIKQDTLQLLVEILLSNTSIRILDSSCELFNIAYAEDYERVIDNDEDNLTIIEDHEYVEYFDGTSCEFHEIALENFWYYDYGDMIKEIEEVAGFDITVYHYKGKYWYVTPAVKKIELEIPVIDEYEQYFSEFYEEIYYIETNNQVLEKIKKTVEILQTYKAKILEESLVYYVQEYLKKEFKVFIECDKIAAMIEEIGGKRDYESLAKIIMQKIKKEDFEDEQTI